MKSRSKISVVLGSFFFVRREVNARLAPGGRETGPGKNGHGSPWSGAPFARGGIIKPP